MRVPIKPITKKRKPPTRKPVSAVLSDQDTLPAAAASGYTDASCALMTAAVTAESTIARIPKTIVNLAYFGAVRFEDNQPHPRPKSAMKINRTVKPAVSDPIDALFGALYQTL